ncbi:hypothetical protein [Flavobacterium tructae]|uniref:Uncharacterized protein n=1 Tax=Flavobacterium tructae TaxID=1114873 RepID=A0A1S1JCV1_9FLAO|nr:hypothetical protein [Flavobacterium tructae]OHT47275.1 hypothetical protein BHE19_20580 [Flavobacterium tructae]OXB14288.1 hypothetical protein B0A71_21860 [Flavobacterium tructae]
MNLGIFKDFWDGHPNHLPFLSLVELTSDESQSFNLKLSFSKLEAILETNSEQKISDGIRLLLEQENWRAHLVASVSLLLISQAKRDRLINLYWERLSRGSWVSPQILTSLSRCDTSFNTKGEKILTEGFTINYASLSSIDHHVLRGGVPTTVSEKKIIAAVNYLLNNIINDNDDNYDNDSGGSIAKNWKEKLTELIKENRVKLAYF